MIYTFTDPLGVTWQTQMVKQTGRVRYYAKHQWWQADLGSRPAVQRCGEYENTDNGHYSWFGMAWQFFALDLASFVVFGKYHDGLTDAQYTWLSKKMTNVYSGGTAFNNNQGLDVGRNYMTGENKDAEDPKIYTLICTGASLGGVEVGTRLRVDHFDATKPPPDVTQINPYTDPRVFFAVIVGKGVEGYRAYKFDQLDGFDVPIPLLASKEIYYPLADLERYTGDVKRSPYYP